MLRIVRTIYQGTVPWCAAFMIGHHASGLAVSSLKYRRRNSSHLAGSCLNHCRSSVLGATSLSQLSMSKEVFCIPLGHSRSTRNRAPSVLLNPSYTRFILITIDLPYERGDPNESSSGSGNDDGGSLAGQLLAIVLSIIFSFRS
jgi:hypothetical protein